MDGDEEEKEEVEVEVEEEEEMKTKKKKQKKRAVPGSVGRGREENAPVVKPVVVRWWRRLRRADSNSTFMASWRGRALARPYTRDLWNFLRCLDPKV